MRRYARGSPIDVGARNEKQGTEGALNKRVMLLVLDLGCLLHMFARVAAQRINRQVFGSLSTAQFTIVAQYEAGTKKCVLKAALLLRSLKRLVFHLGVPDPLRQLDQGATHSPFRGWPCTAHCP